MVARFFMFVAIPRLVTHHVRRAIGPLPMVGEVGDGRFVICPSRERSSGIR